MDTAADRTSILAPQTTHGQQASFIGEGREVLEIGPADGRFAEALRAERGCRVTGVEIRPDLAALARTRCDRLIEGDIETLDLGATFGDERFDAIVFGDVLEHLRDPGGVLQRLRTLLTAEGAVVASIPNVAHGSVRLALLLGRWRYTDAGLLDRTHIRFFTRSTIGELFTGAGYRVEAWGKTELDVFATEVPIEEHEVPRALADAVRAEPDALIYQFVVRAVPAFDVVTPQPAPPGRFLGPLWEALGEAPPERLS